MFTPSLEGNKVGQVRHEAHMSFAQLSQQGWFHQLWSRAVGRRHALLNLHTVRGDTPVLARSHAGVCTVPINHIRGSEGRCNDFDADFRPLKDLSRERWISIVCARQTDVPLPLVELIQIHDTYFVRDGHHRISVARWLGQQEIEAEVTVWHCRDSSAVVDTQASAKPPLISLRQQVANFHHLLTSVGEWLATTGQKLQLLTNTTLNRTTEGSSFMR
jgi:hypothetical protein